MVYEIISGALMMTFLMIGIFFFRFWKKSYDRLFLIFSFSFFLFATERLVLAMIGTRLEPSPTIYLIRLSGFALILIAIVDKNRSTKS